MASSSASPASRDVQLLERQNALLAQSAMLRQRARHQTAAVLAPLEQAQEGMQWMRKATPRNALWLLTSASLLFGKTRPWGLKALRLLRLWNTISVWFKR
jgi:hypothetical protein